MDITVEDLLQMVGHVEVVANDVENSIKFTAGATLAMPDGGPAPSLTAAGEVRRSSARGDYLYLSRRRIRTRLFCTRSASTRAHATP